MVIRKRPVQRTRYYWAPRLVASLIVLFPLSLQRVDFRAVFGHGISVATYKSSPAYAAFEDLSEEYSASIYFPEKLEVLSAGQQSYRPPVIQSEIAVRTVTMKGLTIRTPGAQQPQAFYVAGESLEVATPTALAKKLVEEEQNRGLIVSRPSSAQKLIPTSTGQPILVARADTGQTSTVAPPKDVRGNPPPDKIENAFGFMSHVSVVESQPDQLRPLWLNGQLEMTGGLAFTGSETLMVVKRVVEGQVFERGRIWISEGRFEIHVKSAVGQLVAELTTAEGRVLGRGEMNLVHLRDIPASGNRINDIRIALRPTVEGATMRAVSGYSYGQQMLPVRNAKVEIQDYADPQKVNDEGFVAEASLNPKSTFVARATAPKHWASLVVGQAEKPQDIRLFSDNLVEALIGIEAAGLGERREAGKASIVWGQVRHEGKLAAGVAVQMAGSYEAIYFNKAFIPDSTLKATTENGLFAFINVKRGVQALRVQRNGRTYPAQVFPTEDKHVSYVELELEDRIVTQFKVLDVLNMSAPIEARIRLIGTEEIVPLKYTGMVEYSNGANPFMVEAEAGAEFEVSRVTLTGKPQNVYIPMIRHDWLTTMFSAQNVLALPGRGIIVGFVDDEDFEVELTGYGNKERMHIVYFDSKGNALPGKKNGIAGGGFVVFNAPIGLQTVFIHSLNSRETYSQVVVAEPEYVHVMTR